MRRIDLSLCSQLLVGAIYLASGALKSLDPVQAVLAVGAYGLLPPSASLAAGLVLPGLEAAVGAALLTGFLAQGASAVAACLSLGFLSFTGWASLRGMDVACGCFGPLSAAVQPGWGIGILDTFLLLGSIAAWRRHAAA